jgi:hypothetical protein
MIGRNDHLLKAPISAMLNDAMAQYLAAGGTVENVPTRIGAPMPTCFNNHAQVIRPPTERIAAGRVASDRRKDQIEKARAAAETMSLVAASRALGISRDSLRRMAAAGGFKFQPRDFYIDRTNDPADVERINASKGLGLTRNQVMKALGISYERFHRLLKENSIDFPTKQPRPR